MLELLGTWRTESEFIVWIWKSVLTTMSNPYVNSNEADSWNPTESWGTNTGPTLAIPGIYRVNQLYGKPYMPEDADLERSDGYRWQGCDEFGQLFTRGYGTIELDVRHKSIRPKFHVAMLDIVYKTFGRVDHASSCA